MCSPSTARSKCCVVIACTLQDDFCYRGTYVRACVTNKTKCLHERVGMQSVPVQQKPQHDWNYITTCASLTIQYTPCVWQERASKLAYSDQMVMLRACRPCSNMLFKSYAHPARPGYKRTRRATTVRAPSCLTTDLSAEVSKVSARTQNPSYSHPPEPVHAIIHRRTLLWNQIWDLWGT